jgi:hypothetical protein
MRNIFSFSSSDSATLNNIAIQQPLTGGDAVYSARVMLGLDLDDGGASRISVFKPTEQKRSDGNFFSKIYPNPNNGSMQLDYQINDSKKTELILLDIMGNVISKYTLNQKIGTLRMSENALKNGVYFYEIKIEGEIIQSDKIIIIK